MDTNEELQETLVTLTADIAAEYLGNNNVAVSDIELVIQNIYRGLSKLSPAAPAPETDHSAVQLFIRRNSQQVPSQTQQQRRKRRSSQPAAPQPRSLRGTVQHEAWQELLRQDAAVQELFLIQYAADAATCAGDIHIIGR